MAHDIKEREHTRGVKALDKAAVAGERMKGAYIRTKDKAEQGLYADEASPTAYAGDSISHAANRTADEGVHALKKAGRKGIRKAREKIKEHRAQTKIKTRNHKGNAIRQSARSGAKTVKTGTKGTVKTAQKSVKTAQRTAKTAVKTTQQVAKTAQKTAQATAKAAQRSAQAAKAAAKAAATAAKAAVKATVAAVKAIIAATKSLIAAIAAGGWVAVVIIVIICLIGLIVGSCFGIFFSGEDNGGQPMTEVVREINSDYQAQIDNAKANVSYDVLEMSGSRAVWREVLSVYAVKTATDPDNPQEVATMDESKKAILKDIFWQMHTISSRTETKTETVLTETDDGQGNIIQTESTVTRTYLYITVSHKTAEEMAEQYGFSEDQRQQLAELLADENSSLWSAVLYGIGAGSGEIVTVALSQVGNIGGEPYWSWYGFGSRVEWCACFVSWCAEQCGYLESGVLPRFSGCTGGAAWFQARDLWQDNSYEPRPGDIIFFDWDNENGQDGLPNHVGIVEKVADGRVFTIEGNSGDTVRQNSYPLYHHEIFGYGCLYL